MGLRLSPDEAIQLVERAELPLLGLVAREKAAQRKPGNQVSFLVDQTIVYSNVCQPDCPFCHGTVTADDPRAFTLTPEQVVAQAAPAVAAGAQQIILQGGHRIDLEWEYYLNLIRALKEAYPGLAIAAFSPSEIMVFNAWLQRSTHAVMAELQAAGMDLLLSGGAEALGWIRQKENRILLQGPWNEWFDVLHRAHDLGIPVVGTVPFGLGETAQQRVGYLYRMRSVQSRTGEKSGRGVFQSVVPLHAGSAPALGTALARGSGWPDLQLPPRESGTATTGASGAPGATDAAGGGEQAGAPEGPTGYAYLRMVALTRLLVDNTPHVQASFVTEGAKVAQVALDGGADDLGGTQYQFEGVELAAGRTGRMTQDEVIRLVRDAGRVPVRRSPTFDLLERFETA